MNPEHLLNTYAQAVPAKDIEAYISVFAKEIHVFDMWQEWSYESIDAWREMAKNWFASLGSERDVVTFRDANITECGEMALITAIAKFTAVSEEGKELRYLENRYTWVALKKGGDWKIIHQHTSSPIESNTTQAILHKSK